MKLKFLIALQVKVHLVGKCSVGTLQCLWFGIIEINSNEITISYIALTVIRRNALASLQRM